MNHKVLAKLEELLHNNPGLLRNKSVLEQTINYEFGIDISITNSSDIGEIASIIDDAVLANYFSDVWQPHTKKFKYSGLTLIDEVNALNPRRVLDVGCGYNEFKGKINNLVGIDPYNRNADIMVKISDYHPQEKFDVVLALGSINFGSTSKIFSELEHVVGLCNPGAVLFFRVNPGLQHEPPESKWISFYPWDSNFVINCAREFGVEILDMRNDSNNRMYFVWRNK